MSSAFTFNKFHERSVIIWFPGRPNGTISTITQLSPNSETVKYHLRCWQIFHKTKWHQIHHYSTFS
ncbi:hypothetical protein T4A_10116 [Trichinella pseudospiralis]|uniref:Uncharacterized protein n=1 Tax=Trichinella pseudospiralis TaxID=6337 RepID=A0A0V1DK01_TRIPS|nr:hypothetical protein T4A_10116 [Trichinella pseudospiralis]